MDRFSVGIDYGTESARAILVNVVSGDIVASSTCPYPDGVIDTYLPGSDQPLAPDWALQNPGDWLMALETLLPALLANSGVQTESVIGIGLDFTSCTILPTTVDGTPLCALDAYRAHPHAWAKLWKHHAAQPQADRVNTLAQSRREHWLARYGGKISSEWLIPKALQMLEEAPELYEAAARIVEGADWVVWQLTGRLARNACAAGYKGLWHKSDGYPDAGFLTELHPGLADLYTSKIAGPVLAPGQRVGGLTAEWAGRLGLLPGTPVAAPIIDAHSAMLGGGISGPGIMFMIMGTSTCHLLMSEREMLIEGIAGVVEDGIVPGLFGYEAGQAGVGDIFAWFVKNCVPPEYHAAVEPHSSSLHTVLTERAKQIPPGANGLLALDWWNGNRSTLVDAELSGMIVGYTLATKPEEIYRALIESTAFGTRLIIDAFTAGGVPISAIVAGGGLTKNELLMQIYANVIGQTIAVAGTEMVSALGAAMLGAVAAGQGDSKQAKFSEIIDCMAPQPHKVYQPEPQYSAIYNALYAEYRTLYDCFGRGTNNVMKILRRLREAAPPEHTQSV